MPNALAFTNRRINMHTKYFAIQKSIFGPTPPTWNTGRMGFHFRVFGYYIRIGSFY